MHLLKRKRRRIYMKYGYIRVSTKEQNIDRQLTAILEENIEKKIYIDKASGKDFNRKRYKKLFLKIKEGCNE